MAHGTPDYGRTNATRTTFQTMDVGELAVRLGSPIAFDRRGDVIWWDDFECSLNKWTTGGAGAGSAVAISAVRARNGGNSALLTAGSTAPATASIVHDMAYPVLSKLGFEVSFTLDTTTKSVYFQMQIEDGAKSSIYRVKLYATTNTLVYLNAAGGETTIAVLPTLAALPTLFHTLKMVVDSANKQYVRVILDSNSYPLTGIGARVFNNVAAPELRLGIEHEGTAVINPLVYVDDVIVTQNEP